jgi:hypothetical protein
MRPNSHRLIDFMIHGYRSTWSGWLHSLKITAWLDIKFRMIFQNLATTPSFSGEKASGIGNDATYFHHASSINDG